MADWDNSNGDDNEDQEQSLEQESDPDSNSPEEEEEETFPSAQTIPATEPLPPGDLDREEGGFVEADDKEEQAEEGDVLSLLPLPGPSLDPEGGSSDEYIPSSPLAPPATATAAVESNSSQKRPRWKSSRAKSSPNSNDHTPPPPSSPRRPNATKPQELPLQISIPASTHISRIRSLGDTLACLTTERARDLSGNLLVAFAIRKYARGVRSLSLLRQRKGQPGSSGGSRSSSSRVRKGKKRARSRGSNQEGEGEDETTTGQEAKAARRSNKVDQPFIPPKKWTAWPMPPDQVPRLFHTDLVLDLEDPFTFTSAWESRWGRSFDKRDAVAGARMKSREELEGWIIASITRVGRERWDVRSWEGEGDDDGTLEKSGELHARDRHDSSTSQSSSHGPQMFSSQAVIKHKSSQSRPLAHFPSESDGDSCPSESPEGDVPVPLADDETARSILLPATRRIVAQLDNLLLGLHRLRWGQAYSNSKKRKTGGRTEMEDESASGSGSKGAKRKWKATSTRRGRASGGIEYEDEGTDLGSQSGCLSPDTERKPRRHESNSHRKSISPSPRERERQRLCKLGLRDWSDVLGTAAVVGWDRNVLARAGARCARLFGEGMEFRDFVDPVSRGQVGRGVGGGESGGEWGVCPNGDGVWGSKEEEEREDNEDEAQNNGDESEMDGGGNGVENIKVFGSSGDEEEEEEEEEEE